MYTRILVPLDGSKTAEKALPYARYLATRLKLPVELLEVIDVVELGRRIAPEEVESRVDMGIEMLERIVRSREQYLRTLAATFGHTDVKCTVEKGVAAEFIIDRAAMEKGTLINMATHGRSGVGRWLLGSVAEKVLRGTANPLLLVRSTDEAAADSEAYFRSVIVPLDGSAVAEQALPAAAELARQLGLEIVLFRAYNIPYTAYVPIEGYYPVDEKLIATLRQEATAYLDGKAEEIRALGVEKVSTLAKEGIAADEIIALGRSTKGNLISMCTHGRSGINRWVLGSVTETVVRHSSDPLLVLRAS